MTPDPNAMRAEARWLRDVAGRYRYDANRIRSRSVGVRFSGPAANAFRSQSTSQADRLQRAATALFEAADVLQRVASRVDQERRRKSGWF